MADEQYEWLDKDAAEKLLRGEPVVPLGDQARDDALRLAEALGAARDARRAPAGELPGEDAVLTAFRQATRSGRDRLAGRSAGPALPGQPGTLHSVHIGAAPSAPPRRPRWSRPVRFGLAVSLAGCALGGVAVAAGAGVLPGPFGGQDSPAPASSVSAATPEPLVSGLPLEDPTTAPEPSPPDAPDPASPPGSRKSGTPEKVEPESGGIDAEADGGDRPGDRNRPGGTVGPGASGGADASGGSGGPGGSGRENATKDPTGGDEHPGGSGGHGQDGNWYAKSVKACKAFRAGTLDERSRRQLVQLAKGEENLERFCDRLLDGSGSGGPGNGSGGGDGDGPGDGDGGSLPPVSFEPAPPRADGERRADVGVRAEAEPEAVAPMRSAAPGPTAVLTR
ncbi:hypothetical protein GTY66_31310 [Streptomyces sp. SID8356]|uniref:hypothetical protein n=2 Tax=unclassified Streptomyces TaxID=2593676 RepID=UPI0003AAAFFB|nr:MULTISPECIES: hypothetical protein [unclassified Streptomyces]MYT40486.1 hypothetical protein [Streptomyces sp. SID8356]